MGTRLRVAEQRRFERYDLVLNITVREPGGKPSMAKLQSFSAGGCAIAESPRREIGARIWVRLPGLESQLATIIRGADGDARLAFCRPLHTAVAATFAEVNRFGLRFAARSNSRFPARGNKRAKLSCLT